MKDCAPPPAPLAFAAYCCRWGWGAKPETVRALSAKVTDWDLQLRIFRRNRIEGLAWQCLKQSEAKVPATAASHLHAAAARIGTDNLRVAAECERLRRLFSGCGIPVLFVKGLTLAQLAYGNILTKSGWDIDILIDSRDLHRVMQQISDLGYSVVLPQVKDAQGAISWHRISKESVWKNRATGLVIELHTRLADNPRMIPYVGMRSPSQQVLIATNVSLPTLATRELFTYLCVHGASSAWFRLKWIADMAALLSRADETEIDLLYEASQELGAGRAAGLALLLSRWLFDTPVSHRLLEQVTDGAHLRLFDLSKRTFTGAALTADPTDLWFGTVPIHLAQFLLQRGVAYKIDQIRQVGQVLRARKARCH